MVYCVVERIRLPDYLSPVEVQLDNQIFCNAINAAGVRAPCDSDIFLALLPMHILCEFVCIVAGIVAMLSPKRAGRHPTYGFLLCLAVDHVLCGQW